MLRRLRWTISRQVQSLELAPDRRHAFVSLYRSNQPAELYNVNLTTGRRRKLANGISPAVSPDKTRLAYVRTELRGDIKYRTALVIRTLRTGETRSLALGPRVPMDTPPALVINWSPDSRTIAARDDSVVRLVDVASAVDFPSQPELPRGETAPAFLNSTTLVVQSGCCIGPQQLTALDLRSGERTSFAMLSSPVEQVRRVRTGTLLVVTALRELVVVSRGRMHVIARGIAAAAP